MAANPPWLEALDEKNPEFAERVAYLRSTSRSDGVLSGKTKTLISMALDAGMNHPEGVANLAAAAREQGATEDEILETIEVVTAMCGVQGLVVGMNAFDD
jgi:alkylhydroperoxidase/carboxymuconolactone decarboxylase family protein YurZ